MFICVCVRANATKEQYFREITIFIYTERNNITNRLIQIKVYIVFEIKNQLHAI